MPTLSQLGYRPSNPLSSRSAYTSGSSFGGYTQTPSNYSQIGAARATPPTTPRSALPTARPIPAIQSFASTPATSVQAMTTTLPGGRVVGGPVTSTPGGRNVGFDMGAADYIGGAPNVGWSNVSMSTPAMDIAAGGTRYYPGMSMEENLSRMNPNMREYFQTHPDAAEEYVSDPDLFILRHGLRPNEAELRAQNEARASEYARTHQGYRTTEEAQAAGLEDFWDLQGKNSPGYAAREEGRMESIRQTMRNLPYGGLAQGLKQLYPEEWAKIHPQGLPMTWEEKMAEVYPEVWGNRT